MADYIDEEPLFILEGGATKRSAKTAERTRAAELEKNPDYLSKRQQAAAAKRAAAAAERAAGVTPISSSTSSSSAAVVARNAAAARERLAVRERAAAAVLAPGAVTSAARNAAVPQRAPAAAVLEAAPPPAAAAAEAAGAAGVLAPPPAAGAKAAAAAAQRNLVPFGPATLAMSDQPTDEAKKKIIAFLFNIIQEQGIDSNSSVATALRYLTKQLPAASTNRGGNRNLYENMILLRKILTSMPRELPVKQAITLYNITPETLKLIQDTSATNVARKAATEAAARNAEAAETQRLAAVAAAETQRLAAVAAAAETQRLAAVAAAEKAAAEKAAAAAAKPKLTPTPPKKRNNVPLPNSNSILSTVITNPLAAKPKLTPTPPKKRNNVPLPNSNSIPSTVTTNPLAALRPLSAEDSIIKLAEEGIAALKAKNDAGVIEKLGAIAAKTALKTQIMAMVQPPVVSNIPVMDQVAQLAKKANITHYIPPLETYTDQFIYESLFRPILNDFTAEKYKASSDRFQRYRTERNMIINRQTPPIHVPLKVGLDPQYDTLKIANKMMDLINAYLDNTADLPAKRAAYQAVYKEYSLKRSTPVIDFATAIPAYLKDSAIVKMSQDYIKASEIAAYKEFDKMQQGLQNIFNEAKIVYESSVTKFFSELEIAKKLYQSHLNGVQHIEMPLQKGLPNMYAQLADQRTELIALLDEGPPSDINAKAAYDKYSKNLNAYKKLGIKATNINPDEADKIVKADLQRAVDSGTYMTVSKTSFDRLLQRLQQQAGGTNISGQLSEQTARRNAMLNKFVDDFLKEIPSRTLSYNAFQAKKKQALTIGVDPSRLPMLDATYAKVIEKLKGEINTKISVIDPSDNTVGLYIMDNRDFWSPADMTSFVTPKRQERLAALAPTIATYKEQAASDGTEYAAQEKNIADAKKIGVPPSDIDQMNQIRSKLIDDLTVEYTVAEDAEEKDAIFVKINKLRGPDGGSGANANDGYNNPNPSNISSFKTNPFVTSSASGAGATGNPFGASSASGAGATGNPFGGNSSSGAGATEINTFLKGGARATRKRIAKQRFSRRRGKFAIRTTVTAKPQARRLTRHG